MSTFTSKKTALCWVKTLVTTLRICSNILAQCRRVASFFSWSLLSYNWSVTGDTRKWNRVIILYRWKFSTTTFLPTSCSPTSLRISNSSSTTKSCTFEVETYLFLGVNFFSRYIAVPQQKSDAHSHPHSPQTAILDM